MSLDNLFLLDDSRLLAVARNVKSYERSEDLSGLVLELAARLEEAVADRDEFKWMYEDLCK